MKSTVSLDRPGLLSPLGVCSIALATSEEKGSVRSEAQRPGEHCVNGVISLG